MKQPKTDYHNPELPEVGTGCLIARMAVLLAVAVVHGALAFGCYLVNEHRRLSHFESAALMFGDVNGLYWFLRFVVHWEFGELNTDPRKLHDTRFPRAVWIMIGSMAVGMLAEFAMTISLTYEEKSGFQRAVPAVCQLESIHAQVAKGVPRYWKLDGRYQDATGEFHRVTFYVRESDGMPKLPVIAAAAIRRKQVGTELSIVYDPDRPSRSWIPELGWDDGNRLHYFSFLILIFQFLISMLFVVLLRDAIQQQKHLPWWHELHCLIPLGTQAFILALFGGLELYIGKRFCP